MKKTECLTKEITMGKFFPLLFCALFLLSGCSPNNNTSTNPPVSTFKVAMELTADYDDSEPFIDARLFYVTDNIDSLKLDISLQLDGESGILEVSDNTTKQVIWHDNWQGNIDEDRFTVLLEALEKDREYAITFTGTKINSAKIIVTSDSNLIMERTRPMKKDTN